jgi:hypothetical protein
LDTPAKKFRDRHLELVHYDYRIRRLTAMLQLFSMEIGAMAFRRLTSGDMVFHVNLDQVAYLRELHGGTAIEFAAISDHRAMSLTVDQPAHEILSPTPDRRTTGL